MKDPLPLLSQLFDGALTEEQAKELRERIKNDPRFAEEVVLASALHSNLRDILSGRQVLDGLSSDISGLGDAHILPALDEAEESPAQHVQPGRLPYVRFEPRSVRNGAAAGYAKGNATSRGKSLSHDLLRWGRRAAIAASLMLGIGAGVWYWMNRPVAVIANVMDVQWGNGQSPLQVGDAVKKSKLSIASGFLRLTFNSGASVVVQGPARLELDSASKMHLISGRLTTAVPHEAIGFTVETPAAYVVDLGTEVGINVAADSQTHVEVFKGRAQVDMPDAAGSATIASAVLEPAMAVNVPARGTTIQKVMPQPLAFVRQQELLDREKEPASALAAWQAARSQLMQDPSLLVYYSFDNQDEAPAKLLNRASATSQHLDGTLQDVKWDQGRFAGKSGLRFGEKSGQVLLNIPGTYNRLTLATWVNFEKIGTDFSTVFGADRRSAGAFDWKFTMINGAPSVNVGVGADTGLPQHFIGGAFDAAGFHTGQWHFCVFNYDLDAKILRCGIDGRWLKPLKGKHVDQPRDPAKIGEARIGNEKRAVVDDRTFHGRMDEFAIWKRTLSDDEIEAMYRAGAVR